MIERLACTTLTAIRVVAVGLLMLILFLLLAQVGLRSVFDSSVFWFDELARYSYVWAVFLAAILAFADDSHVRVEVINHEAMPRLSRWLDLLGYLAAATVLVVVVWQSYPWLLKNLRPRSSALGLPMIWFYGVVWGSYAAFVVVLLIQFVRRLKGPAHVERRDLT